jgi:1-aminocyclopropane-1-carboxylate deaminase/D-cysteine desulfhydrase-like pyridoxal-dependent ACC family enzyme
MNQPQNFGITSNNFYGGYFKVQNIVTTPIYDDDLTRKNISLSVLRLDEIHPVVSGNKIFKLYYFLREAISTGKKIITLGGAYSNHLAATAAVCKSHNLQCIGIVRGEKAKKLSPTLLYCLQQGMQLEFISRDNYKKNRDELFPEELKMKFGNHVLIPEGGYSKEGANGAAKIYDFIADEKYTHICCSVGTGTTLAGLIRYAKSSQRLIGFSALKNYEFEEKIHYLTGNVAEGHYHIIDGYHFGGYAKKTVELINFMNSFYERHVIPLDFVYTAKMMYGVIDLINKNYFAEGSNMLCIHTGGLQGNCSLNPGILKF